CCDASDEYNSPARCLNTCRGLGQRERAAVEDQMRALDEGLRLRQELIQEGVLIWREKQDLLGGVNQIDFSTFQDTLLKTLRRGDVAMIKVPRSVPGSLAEEGGPNFTTTQSPAQRAEEELRKVEEAYDIANTEISDLKERLNADYGPEREFLYLSSQCFQLKVYD
ncbi:unnamed protein product, partial [Gadus morhua 'NCC']